MQFSNIEDLIQLAKRMGALPCPCCGADPFLNVCVFNSPQPDDLNGLGFGLQCSEESCRMGTIVIFDQETYEEKMAEVLKRWNRRVFTLPVDCSFLVEKITEVVLATRHEIAKDAITLYANGSGNNARHELLQRIESALKDGSAFCPACGAYVKQGFCGCDGSRLSILDSFHGEKQLKKE